MPRKAQAEFALILGLLIIAIVVALYTYSAPGTTVLPAAMTEEQRAVYAYVGDFIREASTSTISQMYRNGGYIDSSTPAMGAVDHQALGDSIAYWQVCGNAGVPDMEQEFVKGVREYIQNNMPQTQTIAGNVATFGKQSVDVSSNLQNNKVTVTVGLPTTVQGQAMPQPYVVDISTKMGRIADFAQNFARMQADCRVLDNSLLQSISQSNENSRPCWIPTVGNAQRTHTFTWMNLRDCMEMHIKYSLSNTLIGQEYPVLDDKIQVWGLEFFPVPAVIDYSNVPAGSGVCSGTATASSKKYDDLRVTFYYGDDDGLDRDDFSAPESLRIQPKIGPFSRFMGGIRVAEYAQTYSVRYPVVVSVWDNAMNRAFKFGTMVYISGSVPGECSAIPDILMVSQSEQSSTYDRLCVQQATEDANIVVRYDDGSSVVGATASFLGCELGTTGSGLPISGKIPAAWGALTVKDGQNEYTRCFMYSDLLNAQVTIPRSRHFTFNFYTIRIIKSGSTYTISSVSAPAESIEVGLQREGDVCDPPGPEVVVNRDDDGAITGMTDVANLPVSVYNVSVETNDGQYLLGFVQDTGFTPSGTDLYVYAPRLDGLTDADLDALGSLYDACGIDPVTAVPLAGKEGCSWTG